MRPLTRLALRMPLRVYEQVPEIPLEQEGYSIPRFEKKLFSMVTPEVRHMPLYVYSLPASTGS